MRFSLFSLVTISLFLAGNAYKYAIFVPYMANSQVQFNVRIAETLANGGHDVTMIMITYYSDYKSDVKIPKGVKTHFVYSYVEGASKEDMEKEQAKGIFKDTGLFDSDHFATVQEMMRTMQEGCRITIRNKEFTDWLANEKFDVAYAYIYQTCPIGLIHQAKIPAWVWLNSGPLMDFVAQAVGVPAIPSYVPPVVMDATDEMTFFERTKSFIGHSITSVMVKKILAGPETQIFREELNDPNFPDTMELGAKCPLVIVNTNELYDLPRPLLAKVVNIGGLGVGFDSAKPLTEEFKKITETGKGTIIFSFGSVAAAHEMPLEWKNSLLAAFAEFPDYQFVMRYVKDDLNDRLPKNVHVYKWLPQKDLLLHSNTKAFITHGGYNSLQEAISAGVPMVTIALFGDQLKNAKIARKHGIQHDLKVDWTHNESFAVNVVKSTLSKETVVAALEEILGNPTYSQKAKLLSAMVRKQPIKPAELLLKWSEFLAEFKTLENLEPAGQKLNVFQYFSLDVIGFLLTIVILVLLLIFLTIRAIIRLACRKCFKKSEKLKTN